MKKVMIVLEILILVGLPGCVKSKEKTIVGKWKEVGGTQTIEFFKDGTVTVVDKGEPPLPGDYRFIDDNRIRMNLALFGPITAEISPSLDEITLTNPFGKIEKYRKLRQMNKITKSMIAGNYTITRIIDGKEYKDLVTTTLKEDGTALDKFAGEWTTRDNELELHVGQDVTLVGGQITIDTLYREFPAVSLTKQRNAKVIERIETRSILWSNYSFTGDRSNMVESVNLEIKEDGTFQEVRSFRNAWRIKDSVVEITVTDENQKEKDLKGKIEGNTIVFKDGETEIRFVKQDATFHPLRIRRLLAPGSGDTIDSIPDEEMIWVKCNNPACKAEYQTSKKGYFKYVEEHANPMAPTPPPLVCEKCGEQSVYRAEKCMNPDCGIVFLRGAVPNDFPDRCPECGYSTTEETRKARLSGR